MQLCGWLAFGNVYCTLLNKVLMQQCGPEVLLTQHKGLMEMQCAVQILVTVNAFAVQCTYSKSHWKTAWRLHLCHINNKRVHVC